MYTLITVGTAVAAAVVITTVTRRTKIGDIERIEHAGAVPRSRQVDVVTRAKVAEARIIAAHQHGNEAARNVIAEDRGAAAIVDALDDAVDVAAGRVRVRTDV